MTHAQNRRALPLTRNGLAHYVGKLAAGEPFSLARYGDGEWLTLLGHLGGRNSNGCTFTPKLRAALLRVLRNAHPYEHAILRVARRKLGASIKTFCIRNDIAVEWTLGDTLLEANLKGQLLPLVEQLREKRVGYVGPPHTARLGELGFFEPAWHILPPARNAIEERQAIVAGTLAAIEEDGTEVVGFSSGLHSKVFIDDLWELTYGEVTLIDFGSMWDGYAPPLDHVNPKGSRNYIRTGRHDFERLRRLNTGANA